MAKRTGTKNSSGARGKTQSKKAANQRSEKEYNAILKWAVKYGVYIPKDTALTRKRKSTLSKIARDYAEQIRPGAEFIYAPVPKATKKEKKVIKERAQQVGAKATKTGLFVPAEKHKKARIGKDETTGEFFIEKSGKEKRGETTKRKIKSRTPLAGIDALEKEKDRLRKMAQGMEPLKKGESIVFIIKDDQGEGVSNATYGGKTREEMLGEMERMFSDLDKYRKNVPTRTGFYRHVTIEKWTPAQVKNSDEKKRERERAKRNRVGRSGPHDTRRRRGR